jgi:hypothetical protein
LSGKKSIVSFPVLKDATFKFALNGNRAFVVALHAVLFTVLLAPAAYFLSITLLSCIILQTLLHSTIFIIGFILSSTVDCCSGSILYSKSIVPFMRTKIFRSKNATVNISKTGKPIPKMNVTQKPMFANLSNLSTLLAIANISSNPSDTISLATLFTIF